MSEDNEGPIIKYVLLLGKDYGLVDGTLSKEMRLLIPGSSSSEEEV